ncbi:MAG: S8 family serine peptidase [Planctomycetota bacterium]|nr:MAG: S8 family serine peptidase [Planctomycetota bacterium]
MKKSAIIACIAGLASAAMASDVTRPGHFDDNGGYVPFVQEVGSLEFSGSMIVRVRQDLDDAGDAAARALMNDHSARHNAKVDYYIVDVPGNRGIGEPGDAENAFGESLMATELFEYAVPNWVCYPLEVPNDPEYGNQWHHPQINSPEAWDMTHGDGSVILAFTDTGIYKNHSDLAGKIVNGYDAYNNISEDDGGSVDDIHGHGTHVAGCAAAITNNNNGVAGVNWNAQIMMIRVAINSGGGAYYEDLIEGAQWAIENGASIVSASYSGIDYEPIQTMGEYIHSIGGIYMYAANNSNQNHSSFDWQDVIVVGATSYGDDKAGFSSYGEAVDIFAPGVDIGSTTRDGGYGWWSGTSMATPVANGVASMIWAANPNLTNLEVEQILFETCEDLGSAGNDSYWGWGRVDVAAGVAAAFDTACLADWNGDGSVNTQDVLAFLNAWTAGDSTADVNNDGSVNTQDVLAFLNAWTAGC